MWPTDWVGKAGGTDGHENRTNLALQSAEGIKVSKKNFALTFVSSVITAVLLGGCITNAPSSQTDERDLSGTYKVVSQSRKQSLQAESVEVKFFRSAPDVNGGLSAGYLKLAGPSVPDG